MAYALKYLSKTKTLGRILIGVFGLVLFITSCNYSIQKYSNNSDDVLTNAVLDFETLNEKILKPKCTDCHDGTRGQINLNDYDSTMRQVTPESPDESRLYNVLVSGDMPKNRSPLSSVEIDFVKKWILAGAPKSVRGTTTTTTLEPQSLYDQIQTEIFDKSCIGCHNPDDFEGKLDLTSYEALMENAIETKRVIPGNPTESLLFKMTNSEQMPPGLRPKLTTDLKEKLNSWITNGALKK